MKSTGRYLIAAIVVVAAVGLAEQIGAGFAWLFALTTLMALFLTNPQVVDELRGVGRAIVKGI